MNVETSLKTQCPFCGEEFNLSDALFFCSAHNDMSPPAGSYPEAANGRYFPAEQRRLPEIIKQSWGRFKLPDPLIAHVERGLTVAMPVRSARCQCKRETAVRTCPHCRARLTANAETVRPLIVGLLGPSRVGKSHYIVAAVDLMRRGLAAELGIGWKPVGDTEGEYHRRFYKRVYEERWLLSNTPRLSVTAEARVPLIYELTFDSNARASNLALYDIAGYDAAREANLAKEARHLLAARGFMLFVGFVHSQAGVDQLNAEIITPFKALAGALKARAGGRNRHAVPLAVVVTKADILAAKGMLPERLAQAVSHTREVRMEEIEEASRLTRTMIAGWPVARDLPAMIEAQFANVRYFTVSSLGFPAVKGQLETLQPHRVEEPLLWLVNEMTGGTVSGPLAANR